MKQSASTNTDFSAIEDEESGDDHAAGDGERGDCDMEMEDSPLRLNGDREQGACDSAELELRIRDDDDIQVFILSIAFSTQVLVGRTRSQQIPSKTLRPDIFSHAQETHTH